MKWVIVCLVLMNGAFFAWQLGRDRQVEIVVDPEPPATASAMVNRLLLVSELERGVLRQRTAAPLQTLGPAPYPQASDGDPAPQEETAALSTGQAPSASRAPDVECYTLGPLQNEDDISALGAWFSAQGSQATLRTDERREVVSTWVFLPPLATREAADARVREMQAANIDDIYVIPRGDMANAISLGLYSQEESLQRRVSQLEERGFTPSVLPRYRTVVASWFDVVTSTTQPMTVGVLDQVFPDLTIRRVNCGDGPIAGDSAITYNSPDQRREYTHPDNASVEAPDVSGRSGTQ